MEMLIEGQQIMKKKTSERREVCPASCKADWQAGIVFLGFYIV